MEGDEQLEYFPHPTIQLLTHIHMDHLEGLNSPLYNAAPIFCSQQTKDMLLRLEPGPSRAAGEQGVAMGSRGRKRPYEWLKLTEREARVRQKATGIYTAPRDILHALPLNTPTEIRYLAGVKVRITLLDANHMPGSVMFLVEGERGAVLHTGDCRAEKWWLEALIRNPVLQRYTSWEEARAVASREELDNDLLLRSQAEEIESSQRDTSISPQKSKSQSTDQSGSTASPGARRSGRISQANRELRLRNIYIDDECIGSANWPLAKKDAVLDLVSLMERFPADTNFFIDLYTWGYEEIYLAIGKSFQSRGRGPRVHVDRYKKEMYFAAHDPVLPFLTTKTATRFHACERRGECEHLSPDERLAGERIAFESLSQQWTGPAPMPAAASESFGPQRPASTPAPLTVYVKPITSSKKTWKTLSDNLHEDISKAIKGEAPYPLWLACPIDRHSALPELQRFVRAFRPATVTPTTSHPDHYFLAARYLGPALGPGGQDRIDSEAKAAVGLKHWARYESALAGDEVTVAEELKRFREALRQTLDLSQTKGKGTRGAEDGYEADISGVPATMAAQPTLSMDQKATAAPSRLVDTMPSSAPAATPAHSHSHVNQLTSTCGCGALVETPLDNDLARRYFIVLRMFVSPGLRLKNLPGGKEGPEAWEAVRKLRPDLATRTEETMEKEVGIKPPVWTGWESGTSTPVSGTPLASPSPSVSSTNGAEQPRASLAPHQVLQKEARKAIELSRKMHEREKDRVEAEAEGQQRGSQAQEMTRQGIKRPREESSRERDEQRRPIDSRQPGDEPTAAALEPPRTEETRSEDRTDLSVGPPAATTNEDMMQVDDRQTQSSHTQAEESITQSESSQQQAGPSSVIEQRHPLELHLAAFPGLSSATAATEWCQRLVTLLEDNPLQLYGSKSSLTELDALRRLHHDAYDKFFGLFLSSTQEATIPILSSCSDRLVDLLRKIMGEWSQVLFQRTVPFTMFRDLWQLLELVVRLSALLLTKEAIQSVSNGPHSRLVTGLKNLTLVCVRFNEKKIDRYFSHWNKEERRRLNEWIWRIYQNIMFAREETARSEGLIQESQQEEGERLAKRLRAIPDKDWDGLDVG